MWKVSVALGIKRTEKKYSHNTIIAGKRREQKDSKKHQKQENETAGGERENNNKYSMRLNWKNIYYY